MTLNNFKNLEAFNLSKKDKELFFENRINQLTLLHSKNSKNYKDFFFKKNLILTLIKIIR